MCAQECVPSLRVLALAPKKPSCVFQQLLCFAFLNIQMTSRNKRKTHYGFSTPTSKKPAELSAQNQTRQFSRNPLSSPLFLCSASPHVAELKFRNVETIANIVETPIS